MRAKALLPMLLVAASLAACGAGDNYSDCSLGAPLAGSCTNSSSIGAGTCTDVAGVSTADMATFQKACTDAGDTWAASACPTANRVGTCAGNAGLSNFGAIAAPTCGTKVPCTCWRAYIRYYASTATVCKVNAKGANDCGGNADCDCGAASCTGAACKYTATTAEGDCDSVVGNESTPNVFIPG